MQEFIATVASSEGMQRVLIRASSESQAKEILDLDFGEGAVRAIAPYVASIDVDENTLKIRDDAIYKFIKTYKRPRRPKTKKRPASKYNAHPYWWSVAAVFAMVATPFFFMMLYNLALSDWLANLLPSWTR